MREHLAERGFPRRHVQALGGMNGPGLAKAQELSIEPRAGIVC